jgi:phosphoesterase RecJ-like protein
MQKYSYQKFKTVLKKANNILITTHWSPDGDAMGSSLGLYNYLTKMGKSVKVVVPNAYPEFLEWLPGNKQVIIHQKNEAKVEKLIKAADLIFTLDFNSLKRIEKLGELLENAPTPIVMVDHHQMPEGYATYYFHDVKACSTCEMIFDLIVGLGGKKLIDKKIAACLYTGIMTDTGSFRYPSVTANTHLVVSELLKTGMIPADIHTAIYDTYSYERLKLLGYLLSEKMAVIINMPVAYFSITEDELKRFNYQKGDTEGIVNYPFSIKGIKVCALFMESPDGYIKISFRSKGKIDVNKFAREHFSGGGHVNAAGGKSDLSLEETVNKFTSLAKTLF